MTPIQKKSRLLPFLAILSLVATGNQELIAHAHHHKKSLKKTEVLACTTGAWAPFSVTRSSGKADGTHFKKVKEALKKHNLTLHAHPSPWKRCLELAKAGKVDLVYSASYRDERAEFLHYPKSPLETVSYVVVIRKADAGKITWDGDKKNLPQPVGAPFGYSVVNEMREAGVKHVDDGAANDKDNVRKLLYGRVKSIVLTKSHYAELKKDPKLKNKIVALKTPFSKPKKYFVTVSKAGPVAKKLLKKLEATL